MFFKGYVETKDKQCVEKFKNRTDFKNFEQVQSLPEFAGILAEDAVLIDIDDGETSDILFNIVKDYHLICRVYRTTRGKHFIFKNDPQNGGITSCKTHCKLAIGLTADIKVGYRSSYEVLKYNGKMREILYDTAENEQAQLVPQWLHPVKGKMDFVDMDAGDGRNQALFTYILTLQSSGFSVEDARECIRTINAYVLKEPLSDEELEVVLRDDAFKKPIFFRERTFLFDKFAMFLRSNCHIIKINNQLHLYRDGIYISGSAEIEGEMIKLIPDLNKAKRAEVLAYLDILIRENTQPEDANFIAFKNGLYSLADDELIPFTPEHIVVNRIDHNFNPAAYSEIADTMLNNVACDDAEIRALLEETIGYCFYRRNELGKAFILIGDKRNGKSTYISLIEKLLGDRNTSSLDLGELGDRFKTAELFGKLANLGDDIGDEFIANPAIFKKLVTGDRVSVERKGKDPFEFNNYAKLLFSANNIPRIKDKTGAVQRRLIIIPFNATFSEYLPDGTKNPKFNPYIKYQLMTDATMEYLIQLGVKGLKRVLVNHSFTIPAKVKAQLEEYEENNNPVLGFFKECDDEAFQIEYAPTKDVYKRYQEYCLENSLTPMGNIEFSKQVKLLKQLKIVDKKINGKKYRIFVKND